MSDTLRDSDEPISEKDIFFDPECKPSTSNGLEACRDFTRRFLKMEEALAPRERARKPRDTQILDEQLAAILGNLVIETVRKRSTPIAIPQSKSILGKKDSHRILNDKLRDVLTVLEAASLLSRTQGNYSKKKRSTIQASIEGLLLIDRHNLSRKDFRHSERKSIVLRMKKTYTEKRLKKPGKELTLPNTEEVFRMSAEVDRYNDYIGKQSIEYYGNRQEVDDERKTVHRVFNNGSMTYGGRLYGGFWQSLKGAKDGKPDEREDIQINGEFLEGLDYGQIAIRILYSLEGQQVPMEDAYVLEGWDPECREGMKKLINAMINDPTDECKAVKKLFRNTYGLSVDELTAKAKKSILQQHAAIKKHFYGESTGRLFYEESNHLMRLLQELIDLDIPALPVHDCLYVRSSQANIVRQLMTKRFHEHFNVNITVS